jgi:diadenosine tetraphosphate (Ap4A) HIT family hydrolase
MSFELDPKLAQDSALVCDLPLSQVRLSNNAAFPWIILIPKQNHLTEIIDLSIDDQNQLLKEINQASHVMQHLFSPTKLNIANLGNVVPQLHIHVIARFNTDKAWPNPVWNSQVGACYSPLEQQKIIQQLTVAFQG